MRANPILLQIEYANIVEAFAEKSGLCPRHALDFFYHSKTYYLISRGVSDMHCKTDQYLTEELMHEYETTSKTI